MELRSMKKKTKKPTSKKVKIEMQILELEDRLAPGGKSCQIKGNCYIPGKPIAINGAEC